MEKTNYFLEYCEVRCTLTVDNVVDSVSHNGALLQVIGTLDDWKMEKSFTFTSCDNSNPGSIVINGTDSNPDNHCQWGGLLMVCTADDTTSPWHNFVTDDTNWVNNEDDTPPCSEQTGFIPAASNQGITFIADMVDAGAKKIWVESPTVSLKGTPPT